MAEKPGFYAQRGWAFLDALLFLAFVAVVRQVWPMVSGTGPTLAFYGGLFVATSLFLLLVLKQLQARVTAANTLPLPTSPKEREEQERALDAGKTEQLRLLTDQHEEDAKKLHNLDKQYRSLKGKLEYAELRIENAETERIREMWSRECEAACDLAVRALGSAVTAFSNRGNTMAAASLSSPINSLVTDRRSFRDALDGGSRVPFAEVKERLKQLLQSYRAACAWHNRSLLELPDLLSDRNVATDKEDYDRWLLAHRELVAAVDPVLRRTPHVDIVGEIDEKDLREIVFVSDRHRRSSRPDT